MIEVRLDACSAGAAHVVVAVRVVGVDDMDGGEGQRRGGEGQRARPLLNDDLWRRRPEQPREADGGRERT